MLEVELYKAVGAVGFEIHTAVGVGLGQSRYQSLHGEIAIDEQRLDGGLNIQLHQIAVTEDLAVSGADDVGGLAPVLIGWAGESGGGHRLRGMREW